MNNRFSFSLNSSNTLYNCIYTWNMGCWNHKNMESGFFWQSHNYKFMVNIYFTVTRIFPTVPIYILHWPFCNLRDVNMCTSQLYFQPRLAIVDIGLWDEICICWLYQRPNMPCFWITIKTALFVQWYNVFQDSMRHVP